ncbi:MAG: hypothetical protein SGI74_05225 [Oligoflexia bacterium]|nr:hypothetical protein [Oligoflexia bacterium]
MKNNSKFNVLLASALLSVTLWSGNLSKAVAQEDRIPHLDLEMTGREYSELLKASGPFNKIRFNEFAAIIEMGKRNLGWIDHMNKYRDEANKLSLSSAATQMAYPVETPRTYNPTIIHAQFEELKTLLPAEIKRVLLENVAFTQNPPLEEAAFLEWGRKVDRVYGIAVRWTTLKPYLFQLTLRKKQDIRGYYLLTRETDIQQKLTHFHHQDAVTQTRLKPLLLNLCENSSGDNCVSELNIAINQQRVVGFYTRYLPIAKRIYDNYFIIPVRRHDVVWNSCAPDVMRVPFTNPNSEVVKKFLIDNLEDEWKLGSWNMRLDFTLENAYSPFIRFEQNVTPNVNGLAGNQITMNAAEPLTEYNVKWTIRHEFGHVLGLPDCYVEFYDRSVETMISYQIDTTNLMCSRRGHLKDVHVSELMRVYYKK